MTKIFIGTAFVLTLTACNNDTGKDNAEAEKAKSETTIQSAVNTLSEEEKAAGWQSLFDGQSTKGWHKYGGAPAGSAWKVADGILYLDTSSKKDGKVVGGGDLVSDDEFENFDMRLEWKIAKNGNSGIMFYVHEDTVKYKETYHTGPEMQVLDNAGHEDAKIVKHKAGDLYDLISCSKETVKPAGEWNDVEIKAVNGKLDLYLNGENVVSTTMWDDKWNKMVAASKFKEWPGFGSFKKGRFALQDHDFMVSFRNIRVKRL